MVDAMGIGLWALQGLLAVIFLMAGGMKVFGYEKARAQMGWMSDFSKGRVQFIGAAEMLGAVGIVLPRATGILPWLTPAAAVGLAVVMALAIPVHARRKETPMLIGNVVLGALAVFVAVATYTRL